MTTPNRLSGGLNMYASVSCVVPFLGIRSVWMLVLDVFQKYAGTPFGLSSFFESLMPGKIDVNLRKNRSIQVIIG
jgi:hypothetical protein